MQKGICSDDMKNEVNTPFLKWPGGKRWFVNQYLNIFPEKYNQYLEPFLGGGSVFFALQPHSGVITDINGELINLYEMMRDQPDNLKNVMLCHQQKHCKEYYYRIRETIYDAKVEKAARFLYLNRTCFNGMYRVNKNGLFNVPIGSKNNCVYDIDKFCEYARILKKIEIKVSDFEETIEKAQKGDLIFADPPYVVPQNRDGFIKYNDKLFTWKDQERLCSCLNEAKKRGAYIVLTNADTEEISEMYKKYDFFIKQMSRSSMIAGNVAKRGKITELLITSYEI